MRKRTRIVPTLVMTAGFVGVVPACALEGCGDAPAAADAANDAVNDGKYFGGDVAAVFDHVGVDVACCFGVADVGFIPDAPPPDAIDAPDEGG